MSSVFLTGTSCCETTQADSYCGGLPGWAFSATVCPNRAGLGAGVRGAEGVSLS